MSQKSNPAIKFYLLAIVLGALDLWTKWLAIARLKGRPSIRLQSFLELHYAENRDVAFSLLASIPQPYRRILILAVGIGMTAFLLYMLYNAHRNALRFALALILAGAFGNLFDRIVRGYVVDFIHVHFNQYSWPLFNLADICITCGVIMTTTMILFDKEEPDKEEEEPEENKTQREHTTPETPHKEDDKGSKT